MSRMSLEKRVATLEQEVATMKAQKTEPPQAVPAWRQSIGIFADDPVMAAVFDEALRLREVDRAKARKRWNKPKKKS